VNSKKSLGMGNLKLTNKMSKIFIMLLMATPFWGLAQSPIDGDAQRAALVVSHMGSQSYDGIKPMIAPASLNSLTTPVFKQIREVMLLRGGKVATGEFESSPYGDDQYLKAPISHPSISLNLVLVFNGDHQLKQLYLEPIRPSKSKFVDASYANPESCDVRPVVVQTNEFVMPGTLTTPRGKKDFPLVVFVHGSGNPDRDEAVFALKPFRDMALGLAAKGIATLRYDKRNRVYNTADVPPGRLLTIADETTDDATSAIKLALTIPNVSKVYVLGHSQGGMMVPQIVNDNPMLAGAVVMSGPAKGMVDCLEYQYRRVALDEKIRAQALRDIEMIRNIDTVADQRKILLNKPALYWTGLQEYQQLELVKQLGQPLMFLQGGRDYQVVPIDIDVWKQATIGNRDVTIKKYPLLNHFYTEGTGPSDQNEYWVPGNVPLYVIEDIARWIMGH
jgi:pimeloyl-ACP methyl ester carboxylesterase